MANNPGRFSLSKSLLFWVPAVLLLPASIFIGTWVGEVSFSPRLVLQVIYNNVISPEYSVEAINNAIIWHYRLTRAIIAACCGATLAACGVVLQALLKNGLADPYILGISAGASTGAVAVILLGFGWGILGLSMGAFLGSLLAFFVVLFLSNMIKGYAGHMSLSILLSGIAVSQFFNALTSLIITKSANANQVRGIMFWLLGDLSGVRWDDVWLAVPVTLFTCLLIFFSGRILDAFTFGDNAAASLGVKVKTTTIILILLTSLATGYFVSVVGAIGFVGLVVPHAARLLVGNYHKIMIPVTIIIGSVFMILADIGSRILIEHQVIPIGVVTALVGAPVFAVILIKGRN